MLVSVHIPKCAGTSFRTILHAYYGERAWDNYGRIFSREQARPGIVPAGTNCIHGHFLADAFDDLFPERDLIIWVRHPVERVVSTYHHFLRHPDFRDDCCRALYERKLSLLQFAELDWMGNTASRYVAGKSFEDFAFVGVVEQFNESLTRFVGKFGGDRAFPMPKNNVNPTRSKIRNLLPANEFNHILALNQADLRWYERAVAQLRYTPPPRRTISRPSPTFGLPGAWWPTRSGRPALV